MRKHAATSYGFIKFICVMNILQYLKYANIGILVLAAIAAVLFYANVAGPDTLLYFAYILAVVTVACVVGFFVYSLVEKPEQIKSVALLLAGAIALTLLCYAISSPTAVGLDPDLERTTSGAAIRWSEAGIYGMYILFAGAFITIVATSARNMFK